MQYDSKLGREFICVYLYVIFFTPQKLVITESGDNDAQSNDAARERTPSIDEMLHVPEGKYSV